MFRPANSAHCQSLVTRYGLSPMTQIRRFATKKERVVVLGSGWAGHRFCSNLDGEKYDLHVVSPRNHMLFTPLLSSAAVGTLEIRSVCQPIRPVCTKKNGHFYQAGCMEVDLENKMVKCSTNRSLTLESNDFTLPFDKLVIACGMEVNDFGIEGVNKYAAYMKETGDARRVRRTLMSRLEEACHPGLDVETIRHKLTFVVCGGGPTGVEFAAELSDFLEQDVRKQYPEIYPHASVILVEGNELLSMFSKTLRDYTLRKMRNRKVDVRLGKMVVKVDEKYVNLNDGTKVPYGLLVWSGGVKAHHFVSELPFERNNRDQILTDDHLRVFNKDVHEHLNDVFAIGDCGDIEEHPLPPTAQVANTQGQYLAKFFNDDFDTIKVGAYQFHKKMQMAYVGKYAAAIDVGDGKTPGVAMSGFFAFIAWRSAYWTLQGSFRNVLLVPFDWFRTFVFGRDLTRF